MLATFDVAEPLVVLTAATVVGWLYAALVLHVARQPNEPPTGPRTLELGPEPPAVANLLASRFRVTDEALPATLLDLAARGIVEIEQRGPGAFWVRLRGAADETLTAYELRVLRHLEERAHDGVVPAQALTTGPRERARRWFRAFDSAVVADAQRRGLCRDRLDDRVFTLLGAAALLPSALVWATAGDFELGAVTFVGALALLGWIKTRHAQQPTAAGLEAASRWLGVRAELAANEVFATRSPLEVPLWDRLLAYGAALGVAGGAAGPLPMGVESDTWAWSAHGGEWRRVRIRYPRLLPLGWGLQTHVALLTGVAAAATGALVLVVLAPLLGSTSGIALGVLAGIAVVPCGLVGLGVALVALAAADLGRGATVTGPILRLRAFGSEKHRRHYVAVDDGRSASIRAWIVDPARYAALEQGDVVSVEISPALRGVRSIAVQPEGAPALDPVTA